MDAETGEVLYETEGYTRRYPASVTKVMTALLVLEYVEYLNEMVIFSANAVDIPDYASRMWMEEGDKVTVLEALYGIMLPSGNEVARALAEHVYGTVPDFVARMNQRAVELGAFNTNFVNPCGLPGDGQFVTAYDIALIMQAAIQHPVFVDIIATPYYSIPPNTDGEGGRELRNSNRMVRPSQDEFNRFVIGGKTGFTNAAQHTLVTYARRGEFSFIISVLYAPHWSNSFADTTALIDLAYEIQTERQNAVIYEYVQEEIYEEYIAEEPKEYEKTAISQTLKENTTQELSDTEAVAIALMSLGMVFAALIFIYKLAQR